MTVEDEKITGNHPFKLVPPDIHKVEGAEQLPQIVEYLKRAEQLRQGLGSIIGLGAHWFKQLIRDNNEGFRVRVDRGV